MNIAGSCGRTTGAADAEIPNDRKRWEVRRISGFSGAFLS